MSIYEKTNVARALLYWAKNNNGNDCYYLEDRMYAVADGDMVIILTADSYDEAKRKAKARTKQGEWIERNSNNPHCSYFQCSICGIKKKYTHRFCPNCGAQMNGGEDND